MSQEFNDLQLGNMISANQSNDITFGENVGKDHLDKKSLLCSYQNKDDNTEFAFAAGPVLLICDGMTRKKMIKKRFEMEFEIKKVFFHKFFLSSHNPDNEKMKGEKEEQAWRETEPKQRDYLVVCGEHKLQFLSLPDFHFYHYEIPFKLRNVFSSSSSIIVERFYDSSTEQNFQHHDTFHLYSLSGPFGELLPVIYKTNGFHPQWKFCWQSHQDDAGMVDTADNFVVVYDQKEKVHRVYMARETEEQEVHAAIRYVETLRKQHDSTMFVSSVAPQSAARTSTFEPSARSPAMIALSEVINSDIEGRSPMASHMRSGFGHSTPNNPGAAGFQGTLPTPIFEGNNDSHIWATTPNTPRVNTRGGLERNIHTRTLARMVNDDAPGTSTSPSYGRLQTTVSPYRSHHLPQKFRRGDSNAELLRDFTRMIRDTPANMTRNTRPNDEMHVDFGDLERDPELDLLLSKICLECVYVEPKQGAIPRANKIFISNFLSHLSLHLVSSTGEVMKIIPISKNAERTKRNLAEGGKFSPVTVECLDAAYVKKSGLTVVLSPDFTISIYGGSEKIAPIFISELSNKRISSNFRFFQFADNKIVALNQMRVLILEIPETVCSQSASELMRTCFLNFDRDFARKLLRKWRSVKRENDKDRVDLGKKELADVAIFMLDNVGIQVTKVSEPERVETPEEHGGKQMRPRMTEIEVAEAMQDFWEASMYRTTIECRGEDGFHGEYTVELNPSGEGFEHAKDLMNALHSQCEEWSAFTLKQPVLIQLLPYAFVLAKTLNYQEYVQYYVELFGSLLEKGTVNFKIPEDLYGKLTSATQPPVPFWSFYDTVSHLVQARTHSENVGTLPKHLTKKSLRLLTILCVGRNLIGSESDLDWQMLIGQDWKARLGLAGFTLKSFRNIMKNSSSTSAGKAHFILQLFGFGKNEIDYVILAVKVLLLKFQADAFAGAKSIEPRKCVYATPEEMIRIAQLRWKHDIRFKNVEMMLDSTRPMLIATNIMRTREDENMKDVQDRFLTQTSYRTFSQSFGRAFYQFRTSVPSLLTNLYIPRLCVGGMVYPQRVTCDPPSTENFKLCTEWGNFYNSLAAALRIGSSDMVRIDNEWIVMVSKNIKSTAVVAGMTLGFALNGHLNPFNMYHAHERLSTFDKLHSVALLIGLPASNFASCDNQIYKILATYLGFLMGPTPIEIRLDFTIQTSAISGLGLLFADSGNMNIAKKLINEIGKAPNREEEPVAERYAYKLSAGFSLGLIMLGKGNGAALSTIPFKQNIPSMSTRLIYMMKGMRRDKCVFLPQSATPVVSDAPNLPFANGNLMSSNQTAHHVKENDNINIHQSSEPATIALGMMFMKTHNEFIAEALALPATITDLERIRPDTVYSRVLGYCLVMWDRIEPTHTFVKSLIPQVVREYAYSALHFGVPIKRDEDGEEVHEALNEKEEAYWADHIDRSTISQTFLYTVSAACMAIALKFSSCGGPEEQNITKKAFKVMEYYTKIVLPEGMANKTMGGVRMCMYAGAYTRSSVLSMLVTAMSILKVGTGDLTVMRYARFMRLCDKTDGNDWISVGKKHFEQMVAHQALGILLLGEGRYAFKKDDLSIALTIISTFPTIPQNVADNSHYHQPLRFLWSMAVEPRLLVPFDAAENVVVEVDMTIVLKEKNDDGENVTYKQKAPILLPPLEDLQSISVGGGKFEVVHIKLETEEELRVMKDVMSVGQGRVMLKKYGVSTSEMKINEATAYSKPPLELMKLLTSQDTAYKLDEKELREMRNQIDERICLNSSDEYPNVQVELSTVRDIASRTPSVLKQLQKRALLLLSSSVDLWPDEVNVSNSIHGLADSLRLQT